VAVWGRAGSGRPGRGAANKGMDVGYGMTSRREVNCNNAGVLAATPRSRAGRRAWLSGDCAERSVAAEYISGGAEVLARRWRGQGGEIDLILYRDGTYIFCEVKKARSFEEAMTRLQTTQKRRIRAAAEEYLGHVPEGQLADVRFDMALVNGQGVVRVLENAFGHF